MNLWIARAFAGSTGLASLGGGLQARHPDTAPPGRPEAAAAAAAAVMGGVAEVGEMRALAVQAGLDPGPSVWSADGRWWLVADRLRPRLLLFSAGGQVQRDWRVASLDGRQTSRVSALQASPARRSVVVALHDLTELWEISLDPQAEPIHDGLVHDYRMGEAIAKPGYLGLRRAPLAQPLQDFRIDPSGQLVLGVAPPGAAGGHALEVIHLAVRRRIARLALAGPPDLSRLGFGSTEGQRWLSVAPLHGDHWQCFDRATWAALQAGPCAR